MRLPAKLKLSLIRQTHEPVNENISPIHSWHLLSCKMNFSAHNDFLTIIIIRKKKKPTHYYQKTPTDSASPPRQKICVREWLHFFRWNRVDECIQCTFSPLPSFSWGCTMYHLSNAAHKSQMVAGLANDLMWQSLPTCKDSLKRIAF